MADSTSVTSESDDCVISDNGTRRDESQSEETELIPLEGASSKIWKYFGFPGKDGQYTERDKRKRNEVICSRCKKRFKYNGNTSNMRSHLNAIHPSDFAAMEKEENSRRSRPSSTVRSKRTPVQNQLPALFEARQPLSSGHPRWKKLTESVCYFIAKDMLPFDTVNSPGFQRLVNTFEPRYQPPDRKTISKHYMVNLYEQEKSRVQQQLNSAEWYAITTDMWTSRAKHAYCAVTVHFIVDFKLQSFLISVHEFPDSHAAENIVQEIRDALSEWNLSITRIVAATTDNGANITAGISLLGVTQLPCFSHTLQLAVEQALKLPDISKLTARCKRLVAHFNRSAKSYALLRQKQIALGHEQHALVNDVVTRWNSCYYMVARVMEQQQPLCATLLELKKGDLMPTDSEFANMELFVKTMKPIVDITEALGAQKYVTISMLGPLLYKLLNRTLKNCDIDCRLVKMMKLKMKENLHGHYTDTVLDLLNKAAYLDPRFKSLTFLTDSKKLRVEDHIIAEAADCCIPQMENITSSKSTFRGERKLLHILEDVVQPQASSKDPSDVPDNDEKARREVALYGTDVHNLEGDEWDNLNPLQWWTNSAMRYPRLSQLATKYLAPPATSVPSEQAFSAAGNIVNIKRSCLLPDNVNMLVFLAANLQ